MRIVFAIIIITLVCALPVFASAQAAGPVRAGFPDRSIWLSNAKPNYAEEVQIYTVLYNGTDATVGGTLTFFVDDAKLTSQDVSFAAQSSSIVFTKWTAVSGTHSFNARFEAASGATSTLQQTTTVQVTVSEPPPPSALQQSVDKAAEVAGQFASSSAPIIMKIGREVFEQTEALRNAGIDRLEQFMDNSRQPKIAGTSVRATTTVIKGFEAPLTSSGDNKNKSVLNSVAQTAAVAAHFVLTSLYLFYPLLAFLIFGFLAWAYRRFRRPR